MNSISGIFLLILVSFCLKADSLDLRPAAILAVKIANVQADQIRSVIYESLRGLRDGPTIHALDDCAGDYYEASTKLWMAIQDIKRDDYSKATTLVDEARRHGRSCQSALLTQDNAEFDKSCGVALSIVKEARG